MSFHPEAPSPRSLATTRDLQDRELHSRDLSSSDSDYPPSRYEDLKRDDVISITAFPKPPTREGASEIPNDGTLPGISQKDTALSNTGFGGVAAQGQLFPPMRAETTPVERQLQPSRADSGRPKRGLFGTRGTAAAGAAAPAKLAISRPILQGGTGEQNPFDKIATVDLATAAKNERARREQAEGSRQSTTLIATRPAPQPPAIMQEEAMRRAQSVKRKQVASTATSTAAPSEAGAESGAAERQTLAEPVASTTSAQPSPGIEELRRRSPRLEPQKAPEVPEPRELENPRAAPVPEQRQGPPRRPARPESLNIDVEPQVTKPPPPKLAATGLPKPRQRNTSPPNAGSPTTIGASGAPRIPSPPQLARLPQIPTPPPMPFQSPLPLEESPPSQIYSPRQTRSPPQAPSPPQAVRPSPPLDSPSSKPPISPPPPEGPKQGLDPRISVLPRNNSVKTSIRPSRRRPPSAEDVPPSPEKPAVQRRVAAGLPGNPRAVAMRQIGNETKQERKQTVMFVNNIEYSDPVAVKNILDGAAKKAAQNAQPQSIERTGSVLHRPRPIPRQKTEDEEEDDADQEDAESPSTEGHQRTSSRGSASSRKSILKAKPGSPTQLPPLPPLPTHPGNHIRPHPNDTKSMTFNEKMDMFFPIPPTGSTANGNSRSHFSPVAAVSSVPPSFAGTDDESGRDNRTTKTSIQTQSVVEIADMSRPPPMDMRNTAKFSSDTETTAAVSQGWIPPVPSTQGLAYPSYEGAKRQSSPVLPYPVGGMPMFLEDDETPWQALKQANDCPKPDNKDVMTVILDPSEAHRREEADRESWMAEGELALGESKSVSNVTKRESQFHQRIGEECPTFSNRKEKTRSRKMPPPTPLLLHGTAKKDTVVIHAAEPSPLESPTETYREIQAKLDKLDQPNRESTGSEARKRDLLANLEKEIGMQEDHWREMQDGLRDSLSTIRTSPTRNSVYEVAARMPRQWQAKRGSSLKPSAVGQVQLRSPTPPDTDDSDYDGGIASCIVPSQKPKVNPSAKATLWQPSVMPPAPMSVNRLWAPPPKPLPQSGAGLSPSSIDMAPTPRKTQRAPSQPPDKLQSTSLWQKPRKHTAPSGHLWGNTAPISRQKSLRPATQRPSRKSRRITLLPDILESPQPLPDKRGTLGIFQFPWGERSDTASVAARPNTILRAMPGTMTSGRPAVSTALEARSKQAETEEYSSSFFDDYDDEELGDSDEEVVGEEDFDETMLWEIASLLKTDGLPSKMSLLPAAEDREREGPSVIDEYMVEEDERKDSIIVALDTSAVPARKASLWSRPVKRRWPALGLPQPAVWDWMRYITLEKAPTRGTSRREDPAPIQSTSLWQPREPERRYPSLLWGPVMPKWESAWNTPVPSPSVQPDHSKQIGPVHEGYRRPSASREDWAAALQEAVAASYPKKTRPSATEEDWDAALNEALVLSRGNHHTGLWSKPRQVKSAPGTLWQPGQPRQATAWVPPERPATYKRRVMPEAERPLPVFLWQSMWRIQDVQTTVRKNWLDVAVKQTFTGIQFRY